MAQVTSNTLSLSKRDRLRQLPLETSTYADRILTDAEMATAENDDEFYDTFGVLPQFGHFGCDCGVCDKCVDSMLV